MTGSGEKSGSGRGVGQREQVPCHLGGDLRTAGDDQDGVISGDAAQDPGHHGVIDGSGEQLSGSGRSSQHKLGPGPLSGDEQLGAPPGQARSRVCRQGIISLLTPSEAAGVDLTGGPGLGH